MENAAHRLREFGVLRTIISSLRELTGGPVKLNLGVKTVETHRAAAHHKLRLQSTARLVRYAVRNNMVSA
jgi:FixJ family two-component response regulator